MKSHAKRFSDFHREVSIEAGCDPQDRLCFVADWCDSVVRRIETGDLVEATMLWAILRANGNNSRYAVHLYSRVGEDAIETPLRQKDAALEIAWISRGLDWHWLDAPRQKFCEEAALRGVVPIDKSLISDAFTINRLRGTIYSETGHLIFPFPSPKVGDSTEFQERKGERSPAWQTFADEWNVAHSTEFQEEQVARSTIKRVNKLRLSAYRESRRSAAPQTNRPPSLEALETLEAVEAVPPFEVDSKTVGRSVGRACPTTDDRPMLDSPESPLPEPAETPSKEVAEDFAYSSPVRQWLETNVRIPGFPLEDPELRAIASTIHTAADLDQFQKAASRQLNPRGWRVYVKIAQQCAAVRPTYSKAADPSASGEDPDDYWQRRARELASRTAGGGSDG